MKMNLAKKPLVAVCLFVSLTLFCLVGWRTVEFVSPAFKNAWEYIKAEPVIIGFDPMEGNISGEFRATPEYLKRITFMKHEGKIIPEEDWEMMIRSSKKIDLIPVWRQVSSSENRN